MKTSFLILFLFFSQMLLAHSSAPRADFLQLKTTQIAENQLQTAAILPLAPIEPKAATKQQAAWNVFGVSFFFAFALLIFLAGMSFFSVGLLLNLSLWLYLGLGLEIAIFATSLILAMRALLADKLELILLMLVAPIFSALFLVLKGALLLTIGLAVFSHLWITGAVLLFFGLLFFWIIIRFFSNL